MKIKTIFLAALLLALFLPNPLAQYRAENHLFLIPGNRAEWPAFRETLMNWRERMLEDYADSNYSDPGLKWIRGQYLATGCKPWNRLIITNEGEPQVFMFAEHFAEKFGQADLLLMGNGYPLLGLDNKNQWDYFRAFYPFNGKDFTGMTELVQMHHGVTGRQIGFVYAPWDVDTRQEPVGSPDMIRQFVSETQVDAVFIDQVDQVDTNLIKAVSGAHAGSAVITGQPPDTAHPDFKNRIHHIQQSVLRLTNRDQWGIIIPRWFERRHCCFVQDVSGSDQQSIMNGIQMSFLNGCGMLVNENLAGKASPVSYHDRSWIKLAVPVLKRYKAHFNNPDRDGWKPLVETNHEDVYGSLWEKDGVRIWTLVNRGSTDVVDTFMVAENREGVAFYDLLSGRYFEPALSKDSIYFYGNIPANGLACYLSGNQEDSVVFDPAFQAFLNEQADRFREADWRRFAEDVETRVSDRSYAPLDYLPRGMYSFTYPVTVKLSQVSFLDMYPDESSPEGVEVEIKPFAIDNEPVTNDQWQAFVQESGYIPENTDNYLKHWDGGFMGNPPMGKGSFPVTWVSRADAQAYADFYKKRLPAAEEYQYALQKGVIGNGKKQCWHMTDILYSNQYVSWIILKGGTDFAREVNPDYPQATRSLYAPDANDLGTLGRTAVDDLSDPRVGYELFLGAPALQRFENVTFRCVYDLH